jgi:hypothetical protein
MKKWLTESPWPRTFVPLLSGAIVGLLGNACVAEISDLHGLKWASLPRTFPFWGITAVTVIAGIYQVFVFRTDEVLARRRRELEESEIFQEVGKRSVEAIAARYNKMIREGDLDQLEEENRRLRAIFGKLE